MDNNKLKHIHKNHIGKVSDKWSLYLSIYDRILNEIKTKAINILEIGVQNGGSAEIWVKYFSNIKQYVGCDINKKCSELKFDNHKIKVIIGNANKEKTKKEILKECPEFDIIIDDGSHESGDIIKNFVNYFPCLSINGVYIIEDLHCSYWQEFNGGLFHPYSSINFFKLLIDVINYEHWGVSKKRSDILRGYCYKYDFEIMEEFLEKIHSVEFVNSMCIIKKSSKTNNLLGLRLISGQEEYIVPGHIEIRNEKSIVNQRENCWSQSEYTPYEELPMRLEELDILERELNEKEKTIHDLVNSKSFRITKPLREMKLACQTIQQKKFKPLLKKRGNVRAYNNFEKLIIAKIVKKVKKIIKKKNFEYVAGDNPWDKNLTKVSYQSLGSRVLIVAELSIPQCKKYRVDQKIEMLHQLGYESRVVSWQDLDLVRHQLQLHALVIFYRVPGYGNVLKIIKEAKRLGVPTFFDVDDVIFDEEILQNNKNLEKLPRKIYKDLIKGAILYKKALSSVDHIIASTATLGREMRKYNQGSLLYVIPNVIDSQLVEMAGKSNAIESIQNYDNSIKIVYGSGTSTHDVDFLEAAIALEKILKKFPNVKLFVHGVLELPETIKKFKEQVVCIPLCSAEEYYKHLSNYDISIAPLEKNIFNHAKSNIKFLEASIFKKPTVASRVAEFESVIDDGYNGFLADNENEWFCALEKLVVDAELRKEIGEKAHDKVLGEYSLENIAEKSFKPLLEKFIPKKKREKKRILFVNVLFNPLSFGGATIVVQEIAKTLNLKNDFEVVIFTGLVDPKGFQIKEYKIVRYEALGLPVIATHVSLSNANKELDYKNSHVEKVFKDVLKTVKPDLVHFHSIQILSASIINCCINDKIPYFVTLHDMWWLCEKQFMVMPNNQYCKQTKIDRDFCIKNCTKTLQTIKRDDFLRDKLAKASCLIVPSQYQKKMYQVNLKQDIKVNENGILFPLDSYAKNPIKEKVRFAYIGGKSVHKGYYILKDIFESLTEKNYDLTIVDLHRKMGGRTIFNEDWKISGNLIISDGYEYEREEVDKFFAPIDVLLFPSQWDESFGLTIREALIRNVWVISTDAGGVVEGIAEGENGNIVEKGDIAQFRNHVERCIANPQFFNSYTNPFKHKIRSFAEQAEELVEFYQAIF